MQSKFDVSSHSTKRLNVKFQILQYLHSCDFFLRVFKFLMQPFLKFTIFLFLRLRFQFINCKTIKNYHLIWIKRYLHFIGYWFSSHDLSHHAKPTYPFIIELFHNVCFFQYFNKKFSKKGNILKITEITFIYSISIWWSNTMWGFNCKYFKEMKRDINWDTTKAITSLYRSGFLEIRNKIQGKTKRLQPNSYFNLTISVKCQHSILCFSTLLNTPPHTGML
jgi:hypothetical protein